jgi:hypothetical protein
MEKLQGFDRKFEKLEKLEDEILSIKMDYSTSKEMEHDIKLAIVEVKKEIRRDIKSLVFELRIYKYVLSFITVAVFVLYLILCGYEKSIEVLGKILKALI